jgi:hypothetical protein
MLTRYLQIRYLRIIFIASYWDLGLIIIEDRDAVLSKQRMGKASTMHAIVFIKNKVQT